MQVLHSFPPPKNKWPRIVKRSTMTWLLLFRRHIRHEVELFEKLMRDVFLPPEIYDKFNKIRPLHGLNIGIEQISKVLVAEVLRALLNRNQEIFKSGLLEQLQRVHRLHFFDVEIDDSELRSLVRAYLELKLRDKAEAKRDYFLNTLFDEGSFIIWEKLELSSFLFVVDDINSIKIHEESIKNLYSAYRLFYLTSNPDKFQAGAQRVMDDIYRKLQIQILVYRKQSLDSAFLRSALKRITSEFGGAPEVVYIDGPCVKKCKLQNGNWSETSRIDYGHHIEWLSIKDVLSLLSVFSFARVVLTVDESQSIGIEQSFWVPRIQSELN